MDLLFFNGLASPFKLHTSTHLIIQSNFLYINRITRSLTFKLNSYSIIKVAQVYTLDLSRIAVLVLDSLSKVFVALYNVFLYRLLVCYIKMEFQ